MANSKISALIALTGAGVDPAADLYAIVDTSVTTTKKITIQEAFNAASTLTALTGANVEVAADSFPIYDNSTTTEKKILVDELGIALNATQAKQEAGTDTKSLVSPAVQQFHPSAAKAWVYFTVSGAAITIRASYNVASVTYNSLGNYTVNFTTTFSSAFYGWSVSQNADRGVIDSSYPTLTAGTFQVAFVRVIDLSAQEASKCSCIFFGDFP